MAIPFNINRYNTILSLFPFFPFVAFGQHCATMHVMNQKILLKYNIINWQAPEDKLNDLEGPKQDLRSRGLCLVPISSTFPVANETTADFWTPTFGGTFR